MTPATLTVVLENILDCVLDFLDHLQSKHGVQKPLKNGLVVKVFDGPFITPTIHMHLILLTSGKF